MRKKGRIITGIVLTVFLTGILTLALDVQPANAVIDNSEMLVVEEGEEYTLHGPHIYTRLVYIAGTLYVTDYDGSDPTKGTLELYAPIIAVTSTGSINADDRGWREAEGTGAGGSGGAGGGGGYGGNGGDGGGSGGSTYGTADGSDIEKGSGGGTGYGGANSWDGGDGGGLISLTGTSTIIIKGTITSDGSDGEGEDGDAWCGGGGSGGGIKIEGYRTHIKGALYAKGGNGGSAAVGYGGGGGGGGRIKVFTTYLDNLGSTVSVAGGSGGSATFPGQDGEDGTFHEEYEVRSDITGVPALTEWGMLVLLLLLVAAGIFVIRQRRATA